MVASDLLPQTAPQPRRARRQLWLSAGRTFSAGAAELAHEGEGVVVSGLLGDAALGVELEVGHDAELQVAAGGRDAPEGAVVAAAEGELGGHGVVAEPSSG